MTTAPAASAVPDPPGPAGPSLPAPVSFRSIMLGSGPRFVRDAFGPVLAFYVGFRLAGLTVGIVVATLVGLASYGWARAEDRSGNLAALSLAAVVLHAVVGLLSRSEVVYLAQPVLMSAAIGIAFFASAVIGRPLAGVFAEETYPFPEAVRQSATFKRVFGIESLAWGGFLIARAAVRLAVLTSSSLEGYLVVNLVTGAPAMALMFTWSFWYGVRGFRRSHEFGAVFAPSS